MTKIRVIITPFLKIINMMEMMLISLRRWSLSWVSGVCGTSQPLLSASFLLGSWADYTPPCSMLYTLIQGVSKKRYFSDFCLISVLEVRFYFLTCDMESESWARFILPPRTCPFRKSSALKTLTKPEQTTVMPFLHHNCMIESWIQWIG